MIVRLFGYEMKASKQGLVFRSLKTAPSPWEDGWWYGIGGTESDSGIEISEATVMNYGHVYACVRVLAETVASIPLVVYQRTGEGREKAESHYLYNILHLQPNPEMTSMQYREAQMYHLLLWGNHYSEIEWNMAGRAKALWPLDPSKMTVARDGESNTAPIVYNYILPNGLTKVFQAEDILHIAGLGFNGLVGQSPIKFSANTLGFGMAMQKYGNKFFAGGSSPRVAIKHPNRVDEEVQERLKASWQSAYGGLDNTSKAALLEEGMDIVKIGIEPEAAQFLESKMFQVEEVCRAFRIPPHMVQHLMHATYSNIEHQAIDFVVHSIRPWCVRIEQAMMLKLLGNDDPYYIEHNVDGLLRGDQQARYQAYILGIQNGFLSQNDVRKLENMNPIGPEGDVYRSQMQMVPLMTKEEQQAQEDKQMKQQMDMKKEAEVKTQTDSSNKGESNGTS